MKRAYSQQSSSSASPPATHAAALFLPKGGPVKKHKVNPDFNPYALPSSPPAPNLAVNAPGDYDSADDLDRDRSRSRSLAPTPAPAKGKGKAKAKKRQASQRVDPEEEDDLDVGGASGSRVGTAARQQSRRSVSTFSNQGDGPTQANAQLDALGIPPAGAEEEDENYGTDDEEFTLDQKSHLEVKEDLRVLLQHFDEAQMERYESYRRSGLGKTAVRKVRQQPRRRWIDADTNLGSW